MFFLRYTNTANTDLERGTSYHSSGISETESTKSRIAEAFSCNEDDVVLLDNGAFNKGVENGDMCYFQALGGLCGFELTSSNLEDAIEEAGDFYYNSVYNSKTMGDMITIFEGDYLEGNEEGCLFIAKKLFFQNEEKIPDKKQHGEGAIQVPRHFPARCKKPHQQGKAKK